LPPLLHAIILAPGKIGNPLFPGGYVVTKLVAIPSLPSPNLIGAGYIEM